MFTRLPVIEISYHGNGSGIGSPYCKIGSYSVEYLKLFIAKIAICIIECSILKIANNLISKQGIIPNPAGGFNEMFFLIRFGRLFRYWGFFCLASIFLVHTSGKKVQEYLFLMITFPLSPSLHSKLYCRYLSSLESVPFSTLK